MKAYYVAETVADQKSGISLMTLLLGEVHHNSYWYHEELWHIEVLTFYKKQEIILKKEKDRVSVYHEHFSQYFGEQRVEYQHVAQNSDDPLVHKVFDMKQGQAFFVRDNRFIVMHPGLKRFLRYGEQQKSDCLDRLFNTHQLSLQR